MNDYDTKLQETILDTHKPGMCPDGKSILKLYGIIVLTFCGFVAAVIGWFIIKL